MFRVTLIAVLLLQTIQIVAQTGRYDIQFAIGKSADCTLKEAYFDIEIKAENANSTFRASDQNYRFSFNREALENPRIVEEFEVAGNILDGPNAVSLYSPHSLNGSVDTVVSYGFELSGGVGYFIGEEDWTKVGRVAFDIVDTSACVNLIWHDSNTFPSTFIGEKFNGSLYVARENSFTNLESCIGELCVPLPIELISFTGEERECEVDLTWQTQTETNSSHFIVEESRDGVSFFELERVEAAGFSNVHRTYYYTDEAPGTYNYYRLKMVDFDGSSEYSDIIKVESGCYEPGIINGITDIYPNPTFNGRAVRVHVYAGQIETTAQLVLRDISGRLMYEKNIMLDTGANTVSFIPENLSPGLYFLQVKSEGWFSQPQKLVVVE